MTNDATAKAQTKTDAPGHAETLAGIALMATGFFFYSMADMLAKLLSQSIHPVEIAWARQIGLLTGALVLVVIHGAPFLPTRHPALQISRGLTAVVASSCFVFAVAHVPLADAVSVTFVAPFMVTILAALVLKEPVGRRRWSAVAIGFAGTLIVIRPGVGVFHPAILLVLISALAFAVRQILSRMLGGEDKIATTVAYTALTSSVLLTIPLPFFWTWPASVREVLLLIAMAGAYGSAEIAVMAALERAQAVVLAPLQYSLMMWGTLWGFLVFAQLPDIWTVSGSLIIIGSGVFAFCRDTRRARH